MRAKKYFTGIFFEALLLRDDWQGFEIILGITFVNNELCALETFKYFTKVISKLFLWLLCITRYPLNMFRILTLVNFSSNIIITIKNIFACVFYNYIYTYIENQNSVKYYSNYTRFIKKIMKMMKCISLTYNNHIFWNYCDSIHLNLHKILAKFNECKILLRYVFC